MNTAETARWIRSRSPRRRPSITERDSYRVVIDAALAWWEARRPCGFTAEDHLREPEVNCCGELERALARAVAAQQKLMGN